MTFKLFRLVLVTAIVFTSCSRDENENQTVKVNALQKEPLTPTQINATINQVLSSNKQFHWSEMSSQMIWSAALQGQNLITVGFGNSETDYDRSKS